MALTKNLVLDKIEILRNGVVQVREAIEVYEDSEFIGQRYIRAIYIPSQELITIPNPKVRALCNFIWTPAVIAAYNAEVAARPTPPGS